MSTGTTLRVGNLMTADPVVVDQDAPIADAEMLLRSYRISGLPVVDEAGGVLGVVSEADFVVKEGGTEPRHGWLDRLFGETEAEQAELAKVRATTAREAMTEPAITVEVDTHVRDAARIMTERQINRLPITDGGRLVGIVTRADIVRCFVRTDEELRTAIVEEVLHREMWLDERDVAVTVEGGVVSVEGTVEIRSDAAILERLIREAPGVVDVRLGLRWRLDDAEVEALGRDLVNPPQGPG